jgi:uncharacterized protein YidB (DUF937 family)
MTWEAAEDLEETPMGILDDLLGGVLSGGAGGQRGASGAGGLPGAGRQGGVMMALLPVLLSMLAGRGGGAGQGGGLGGLLGQVLGGGGGRGSLGDMIGGVLGGGAAGGLGGLLGQMERAGFGDQARSWVGTGENMPISPEALGQVFGQDGIDEIARRAGLTPDQASRGLSELLPEVVDRVTPDGRVPDADQLLQSVDDLSRRLGG